ncbi:hypothetical protein FPV67DRAFT_381510 [Lyophyllum atratum]|nr:hypothetical protein FPV67DRAFT_381510 [Lyophyllum atratum]
MSPEERSLFQLVGNVLLHNLVRLASVTLLYGVFMLLFSSSTLMLLNRGLTFRATRVWLAVTTTVFLLETVYWIAGITMVASQMRGVFIDTVGVVDRATLEGLNRRVAWIPTLQQWMYQLLIVMSDGVLVWRTWVICPEQQRTRIALCALLVGTMGATLGCLVLNSNISSALQANQSPNLELISTRLVDASLALSLATNLTSTLLILYKLWNQLRFKRTMGIKQKSTSPVRKVMLVLVESGFVYCGIQGIYLVTSFVQDALGSPFGTINGILGEIAQMGTAMYPFIVILLVSQQRSMVETFGFSTQLRSHRDPDLEHMPSHLGVSGQPFISHNPPANTGLGLELTENPPVCSITVEDRLDRLGKPSSTAGTAQGIHATASAPF